MSKIHLVWFSTWPTRRSIWRNPFYFWFSTWPTRRSVWRNPFHLPILVSCLKTINMANARKHFLKAIWVNVFFGNSPNASIERDFHTLIRNVSFPSRFPHPYKECFIPLSNRCESSHFCRHLKWKKGLFQKQNLTNKHAKQQRDKTQYGFNQMSN